MKYIVILGDGMADQPVSALGGKTPLEVAFKPNIDYCAMKGSCGMVNTIPEGMSPGSDVANLAVMGYSPRKCYTGRAPLEALSIGVPFHQGDMALRCNLVTLSEDKKFDKKIMLDYSAGEISDYEAKELIEAVNSELSNHNFSFYPGISYRNCMMSHSAKESFLDCTPPHDITDKMIGDYLPEDRQLADLMRRSYQILSNHHINISRRSQGKNPANCIWLWGAGTKPKLDNFNKMFNLKGAVISAVDLLKGIAIGGGMDVINVEGATGKLDTNFQAKAKACVKALTEDGYDYVYLHVEAPDECGHQGDVSGKVKAIELIDSQIVAYIRDNMGDEDYSMLIMPDHATPLNCKTHTTDAVPYVLYRSNDEAYLRSDVISYTETNCAATGNSYTECLDLIMKFVEVVKASDIVDDAPIISNAVPIIAMDNIPSDIVTDSEAEIDIVTNEQEPTLSNDNTDTLPLIPIEDRAESGEFILPEKIVDVSDNAANGDVEDGLFDSDITTDNNAASTESELKVGDTAASTETTEGEAATSESNANDDGNPLAEVTEPTKAKKAKKQYTKEQKKKRLIALIIIAVLAVAIIVASIVTPIVIINKDKIFVNDASDFGKVDKGNYYVLEKDIVVTGDLVIANPYSIDLNGHQLKVEGKLEFSHAQPDRAINIGTKKGKEYTNGGNLDVGQLLINCTGIVNVTSNVKADTIDINRTTKATFTQPLAITDNMNILSGDNVFENVLSFGLEGKLTVGQDADGNAVPANISLSLAQNAVVDIAFVGSEGFTAKYNQAAAAKVKNIVMNDFVEARIHGAVEGTVQGGAKVIMTEKSSAQLVTGMKELWLNEDNNNILRIELDYGITENYIINLGTPQDINMQITEDAKVICSVTKVNNAARYIFRVGEVELVVNTTEGVFGTISCDVTELVKTAGEHTIYVTATGSEESDPDLIRPGKAIFINYVHTVKLDTPVGLMVSSDDNGTYLSWNTVKFADEYVIIINGKSIQYREAAVDGRHTLYITDNLAAVGGYSIRVQARNAANHAITPSDMALTSYEVKKPHNVTPVLTLENKDGALHLNWTVAPTAAKYTLYREDTNGVITKYILNTNSLVFNDGEFAIGDKFYVKANGIGYYEDSVMSGAVIYTIA